MNAQRIKLNLIPGGVIPVVYVSQYDVGRPLEFALYDGPTVATIEAGTIIDIRATKPDGHGFEYACTWSGNVASVATQTQMTVLSGSIECELHLVKNSQEIGTANFILEVEAAALRSDTDISETELPDIIDMARSHEQAAAASQTAAANSASAAAASQTAAATSKSDAEAYAVGKRGGVDVPSTDPTYNNNSKYYSEVAQQAAAGGIIPKGTTSFAQLPALADSQVGDMWNISDDFVTTSDFREGAGVRYGAGSNVYKTGDGKWDVTSGQMIMMAGATANLAGTPGAVTEAAAGQQDHYWTGGAVWKNDTANLITNFTSSDDETETGLIVPSGGEIAVPEIVTGTNHGGLFEGLSKIAINSRKLINTVKRIWNTVANAWVSGVNYAAGQVVTYTDGHTYICKLAHTSSASITPGNVTYWEDKTIGDMIYSLNSKLPYDLSVLENRSLMTSVPNIYGGRVTIQSGGYLKAGGYCYVNIKCKANQELGSGRLTLLSAMPTPLEDAFLEESTPPSQTAGFCVVDTIGQLYGFSSNNIPNNSIFYIKGIYKS